jgi:hypothetical protein
MRVRGLLVLFGSFLTIIAGLGSGHAQSATPSFTISASSATLPTSGTGSIPFTLTSVSSFAGYVGVSCGPAQPPYTLTANGTVAGSLNLVAYIPPCSNPCPVKLLSPPRHRGAVNLALASVLLLGLSFRRRPARWLTLVLCAVGILAGLAGVNACGAGAGKTLTPGTFAYTVSATQTGTTTSPSLVANTTVNVTVPVGISTNLPSANP